MKVTIVKDVYSSNGWRKEGDVLDLDPKIANHYLQKGIAVEYKEEKAIKETKEEKSIKKRVTKKAK